MKIKHNSRTAILVSAALLCACAGSAMGQATTFTSCSAASGATLAQSLTNGNSVSGNTTGGSTIAVSFTCVGATNSPASFVKYHATTTGTVTLALCGGSTWDTHLSVFSACGTAALACNDDSCGNQSSLDMPVTAGTDYIVRIGGYGSTTVGAFTLLATYSPPPPPPTSGPDVAVWAISDVSRDGTVSPKTAFSVGTTSYNPGDRPVDWRDVYTAPGNPSGASHLAPVIGGGVYKLKNGRFQQLSQSWLKHGYLSTNSNGGPGPCQTPPLGGDQLGVNCLDTYGSGLNGNQNYLGPRSAINPATGYYAPVVNGQFSSGNAVFKRGQTNTTDLETSTGGSAAAVRYFADAQYVSYNDAIWNNGLNNYTYVEISMPATGNPALVGASVRQQSAIRAWGAIDNTVAYANADHVYTMRNVGTLINGVGGDQYSQLQFLTFPKDITQRYIVASKVTNPSSGVYHYEYAIQNVNSFRAGKSFSIKVPAGTVISNAGMTFPESHSGEPYSNVSWTNSKNGGWVTFTTDDYATNPNANALRWGTTYTFWFDCNKPAAPGSGKITLFRPAFDGVGADPLGPSDRNAADTAPYVLANGILTPKLCVADIAKLGGGDEPGDGLTVDDLIAFLDGFFSGNVARSDIATLGGGAFPDGALTADDLISFLNAFFSPDPTACN
jgi:hypothetical protein